MVNKQFISILKKDLRLAFSVKTLLITVFIPFIMMFLIVSVPTFFIGTTQATITICSDDVGANIQHINGTFFPINLGAFSLIYIEEYAANVSNLEIKIVNTRQEALNSSNGIYIPANFTFATFNDSSKIEYRRTYSSSSFQGVQFDNIMTKIQEVLINVFLFLNLEKDFPEYNVVEYFPPIGEPTGGWSKETQLLAGPFGYAIFIMVALIGNMGRTIGFSKEKEDGTFETMLTITKNRSHLVLSKLVVGIITSFLSILAYFAGSAFAGLMSTAILSGVDANITAGIEGILAFPTADLLSYKGVLLLIGLGICLIMTMLALMTVDTLFSRQVSERVGLPVIIGFGMLFYFSTIFDPATTAFYAVVNPFYWVYHLVLSIVDLSFSWIDGIFLALIIALLVILVFIARKAIEREKVLFS